MYVLPESITGDDASIEKTARRLWVPLPGCYWAVIRADGVIVALALWRGDRHGESWEVTQEDYDEEMDAIASCFGGLSVPRHIRISVNPGSVR